MEKRKSLTFVEGAINTKKILDFIWRVDAVNVLWFSNFSDSSPVALKLFDGRWTDVKAEIEGSFFVDGTRLICAYRNAEKKTLSIFKIDLMNLVVNQ